MPRLPGSRKIKLLLAEQRLVRDRVDKKERAVRAGDVAILLRALTDVHLHEDALAAEGLNSLTVGGSVFYSRQEIIDLGNLLSAIVNPTDELALAGALRGRSSLRATTPSIGWQVPIEATSSTTSRTGARSRHFKKSTAGRSLGA